MAHDDTIFMTKALSLAKRGAGLVSPNPMVGALLVRDGRVIGEGYHRFVLRKHAEALALEMAGPLARGATLYCNLEPCSHHGRTPPCTDALIEAGIARAVIAIGDPDPRVNGRGIEQLREAGVAVKVGMGADDARHLNESYLKFVTTGAPFVHAVIRWPQEDPNSAAWLPSPAFLEVG